MTRTNSALPRGLAPLLVLALLFAFALAAQSRKPQAPHAVIAGTVFRDPGFSQPGATVVLARKEAPNKKLQQAVSDRRGEFAFRVPPGPADYVVTAALKGFKPDRQEFRVEGEEQINATLLLVPESKN
jgi:hypothetical protein